MLSRDEREQSIGSDDQDGSSHNEESMTSDAESTCDDEDNMLFDDFDDDEQSPLMFSDDEQMVRSDTGGERQSLEDDRQTYIGMDVEILQDELSQSAFQVCELQFNNEMLQASNMELKQKVETLTALCRKYVDRYMNLSIAYQNSVRNIKHLTVLLNKVQFGAKILKNDDAKTRFYTGLPTEEVFDTIFTILEPLAGKRSLPVP